MNRGACGHFAPGKKSQPRESRPAQPGMGKELWENRKDACFLSTADNHTRWLPPEQKKKQSISANQRTFFLPQNGGTNSRDRRALLFPRDHGTAPSDQQGWRSARDSAALMLPNGALQGRGHHSLELAGEFLLMAQSEKDPPSRQGHAGIEHMDSTSCPGV
ncbi:hypothetical protein RRG08_019805 [Elysia crispata]|uniref:Uncharacterized protein n=1 Tax=Elysia crispata TaxID=231223 RepID=A0AAE1AWF9_9GAST|nr:hypothetical protein RRG08_019805 [Elysia crispata]